MPIHLYAVLSLLSALISLLASIAAWRRSAPGSSALSLLLLSMAIWSMCYATRWMDISMGTKIFWFKVMFLGVTPIPTLFFLFVLGFTNNDIWLTRRNLLLVAVQPTISLLLHWTNDYHHLLYTSMKVVEENAVVTIVLTRGLWYFVNTIYSYGLIGISLVLLCQGVRRSGPLYRYQYRWVLVASILPWLGNAYSELNFNKMQGLDLSPITFGLSGLIFAFAFLRTHFLDLIPVARGRLIENMRDGVIVLDVQNRIVDINPAMANFLESPPASYMGQNASEVFRGWMDKIDSLWDEVETRAELKVPENPPRYLDLRVTPLYDRNQILTGRLMVFRDVTERKQDEQRLHYANERLQTQLIEIGLLQSQLREQAIRDPLTNLFNRRYLEETLDRELARARREAYPVCIIMLDLDHFKKVNDTYGHDGGDQVLKALANTLAEQSRRGDFACRYGGEEFVVVMPNITRHTAYERAKKLRRKLNALEIPYECHTLTTTISMGIAAFPDHGDTRKALLRAADRAMYAAKEAGRDHILTYDQITVLQEE
ncbi:MAG: histidine kinase N-terminal 7TM domain-containing protein [Anaerolineales bacterium]